VNEKYYKAEFSGRDQNGSDLLNAFADALNGAFPPHILHARCVADEIQIQCGGLTAWIDESGTLVRAFPTLQPGSR
jgi:hypothetical protein